MALGNAPALLFLLLATSALALQALGLAVGALVRR
jgi:hypothetical protein